MKKMGSSSLSYLYTFIIISSPVLELYGISPAFHTITFRFVSCLLFIVLALFDGIHRKNFCIYKETICFIPFFCSMLFAFFINMCVDESVSPLRWFRWLMYMIFSISYARRYFDGEKAFKIYRVFVYISTLVLIIQFLAANLLGIVVKGYLPFLPLRSGTFASIHDHFLNRYYSIFEEPGYYGMFVGPYLCMAFKMKKVKILEIGLICFSLLISTSTSNIMILAFLALSFLFLVNNDNLSFMKNILLKCGIVICIIIGIIFFVQSNAYTFVVKRLTEGSSTMSRLEGFQNMDYFLEGNFFQLMFGNSLAHYPVSGYATMLITFGVVGTLLYLIGIMFLFVETDFTGKYILSFFLFINIGNIEFLGNASSMFIVFAFVVWFIKQKDDSKYSIKG